MRSDVAQAAIPSQVRALHHPLFVHVSAKEPVGIGLKFANHLFGGQVEAFAPTLDGDAALERVERDQGAGRVELLQKRVVDAVAGEGRRADNHAAGALLQEFIEAIDRPHSAADSGGDARGDMGHQIVVGPGTDGRVKVNHL